MTRGQLDTRMAFHLWQQFFRRSSGDDLALAGLDVALASQDERVKFMLGDLAVLEAYGWSQEVRNSSADLRSAILRANTTLKSMAAEAGSGGSEIAAELTDAVERDIYAFRDCLQHFYEEITRDT